MTDINTVTITGRLVREPLIHHGPTGGTCAQFTVASNHRYKSRDGNPQCDTAFVNCKVFGAWASAFEGRHKGDLVVVAGRLKTEAWERDGSMRNQLTLVCNSAHLVTLAPRNGGEADKPETNMAMDGQTIPF